MKLRNKRTGEIIETGRNFLSMPNGQVHYSLAEMTNEWEDYEEPKDYWYVSCAGRVEKATQDEDDFNETHINGHKAIGNCFETKEEAEKAVEKLKAFKKLKDLGFRFDGIRWCDRELHIKSNITTPHPFTKEEADEFNDCLHKVFGGYNEISQ